MIGNMKQVGNCSAECLTVIFCERKLMESFADVSVTHSVWLDLSYRWDKSLYVIFQADNMDVILDVFAGLDVSDYEFVECVDTVWDQSRWWYVPLVLARFASEELGQRGNSIKVTGVTWGRTRQRGEGLSKDSPLQDSRTDFIGY